MGTLAGDGACVRLRGDLSIPFFLGRLADFCFVCFGKTGGGPPCRLRSEAWLTGSRVRPHCPSLVMCMPQRWEVEPVLDTTCWPRMVGCAAVGG